MRIVSMGTVVLRMTLACSVSVCTAQIGGPSLPPAQLTIDPGTIVTPVSPILYGMMTEEINHSYDGGLYAELLQNRTFGPVGRAWSTGTWCDMVTPKLQWRSTAPADQAERCRTV